MRHHSSSGHLTTSHASTSASSLTHRTSDLTVTHIVGLHEKRLLNLEPGFQRQSVWRPRDRAKLMNSILRNLPLPAIFFYRRQEDGHTYYDVIDGKQRIESILMFMGAMRGRYSTRMPLPGSEDETDVDIDWNMLKKHRLQHLVTDYRIPVIEVDGGFGEIIEVFVRINSTGKSLTQQEKRHAQFYKSTFLKEADRLARKQEDFLLSARILSKGQVTRMKHVEIMCELMLSAHHGNVINRKAALNKIMGEGSFTPAQIRRASSRVITALNRCSRMFPKLHTTRFRHATEFYTLIVLLIKFEIEGMVLTDKRRNQLAWELLKHFGEQVDRVREGQRRMVSATGEQENYRDYLLTVAQTSDDVKQRQKREDHLRSLLGTLFVQKDAQRTFSPEQRRILWGSAAQPKCAECGCALLWHDFTIDHISPHSRGGRSRLENATLMCRPCNSAKGARKRRRAVG